MTTWVASSGLSPWLAQVLLVVDDVALERDPWHQTDVATDRDQVGAVAVVGIVEHVAHRHVRRAEAELEAGGGALDSLRSVLLKTLPPSVNPPKPNSTPASDFKSSPPPMLLPQMPVAAAVRSLGPARRSS